MMDGLPRHCHSLTSIKQFDVKTDHAMLQSSVIDSIYHEQLQVHSGYLTLRARLTHPIQPRP